ncbi:MAG: ABC transporter permease [Chloroflexota bacterium]|nr:ABC transporter permease [Chloroflexota bacterium]
MLRYIIRRIVMALPTLILASLAIFLILRLIPGDPATIVAGSDATPAQVAAVRKDLGLDKPLVAQYAIWIGQVLRGNFGNSLIGKYPVWDQIRHAYPATLELTIAALLLALLLAAPLGILAAMHPRSWLDRAISAFNAFAIGIPNFLLGILLILIFSLNFAHLPVGGRVPITQDPGAGIKTLLLPAVTLSVGIAAVLTRFIRSALLEVLSEDYIRTARAKGLPETAVIRRHALRNALIPIITVLGIQVGRLLGGAVIVEAVFAWPGMGRLAVQAILTRDYTIVQAALLLLVTAFIVVNLIVDIAYGFLDPRVRVQTR